MTFIPWCCLCLNNITFSHSFSPSSFFHPVTSTHHFACYYLVFLIFARLLFSITSRDALIYQQNKLSCSRRHGWGGCLVVLCYFMLLTVHDINIVIKEEILYRCIPNLQSLHIGFYFCPCLLNVSLNCEFLTVANIFCLLFKLFIQSKSHSFIFMAHLQICSEAYFLIPKISSFFFNFSCARWVRFEAWVLLTSNETEQPYHEEAIGDVPPRSRPWARASLCHPSPFSHDSFGGLTTLVKQYCTDSTQFISLPITEK